MAPLKMKSPELNTMFIDLISLNPFSKVTLTNITLVFY